MSAPGDAAVVRDRGQAITVLGPVGAGALGVTLTHEHLHMDARPLLRTHGYEAGSPGPFDLRTAIEARWNPGVHPDNYDLTDVDLVVEELAEFRSLGGATIVDVTPIGLGRDPRALRTIAEETGLHVVMGAGYYLQPTHPAALSEQDEDAIAAMLVAEARDGVGETGISPGILGEIGTSDPPHPEESRVLRAAARAALSTGLAVSVHLHPWGRTGHAAADAVLAEGLDPARVVLGHLTTAHDDERYLRSLLDRGVFVAFDLFGFDHSLLGLGRYPPSDAAVATTVAALVRAGHGDRVLLSGDVGVRTRLRRYGGWSYDHVLRHVVPLLHERGLSEDEVATLLVQNPRAILTVAL